MSLGSEAFPYFVLFEFFECVSVRGRHKFLGVSVSLGENNSFSSLEFNLRAARESQVKSFFGFFKSSRAWHIGLCELPILRLRLLIFERNHRGASSQCFDFGNLKFRLRNSLHLDQALSRLVLA